MSKMDRRYDFDTLFKFRLPNFLFWNSSSKIKIWESLEVVEIFYPKKYNDIERQMYEVAKY